MVMCCNSAFVEASGGEGGVALRVQALSKRYGAIEARASVSFDVRQGEILGLVCSGLTAAKTTLISILVT